MAEPFLSEIRIFSFNFAPKGWALCNGQLLPINQNQALFSLLGTTYGGNGQTTFALPNLQGRTPIHVGQGHTLGEQGGEHTNTNGAVNNPNNAVIGAVNNMFSPTGSLVAFDPTSISNVGGSQAHQNMQPFLTLNFSIALQGIFPSQN
jgi:microcystin-dependent protein